MREIVGPGVLQPVKEYARFDASRRGNAEQLWQKNEGIHRSGERSGDGGRGKKTKACTVVGSGEEYLGKTRCRWRISCNGVLVHRKRQTYVIITQHYPMPLNILQTKTTTPKNPPLHNGLVWNTPWQ